MLRAEERYLIEPGASLGTWFARVQETICVATRVTLDRFEEGRGLGEADLAGEQLGLQADICAEAIRAASRLWPGGTSPGARAETLELLADSFDEAVMGSLGDVILALARCTAALEPLANGLREGDLPMGEPTDLEAVGECFLAAAGGAFGVIHALC